jgi:hypothetical protein
MNPIPFQITKTMQTRFRLLIALTIIPFFLVSCEKEPGEGGKSTLYGKVLVKEYNSTFTVLEETYYGPEIWVYIIYGDNRDYNDRIETGYDGTWEFKYLRPGNYTIYAYSKDSTLTTNASIAVIREVTIPDKKQDIEVPEIVIFN